jgi:hypothetical protein
VSSRLPLATSRSSPSISTPCSPVARAPTSVRDLQTRYNRLPRGVRWAKE